MWIILSSFHRTYFIIHISEQQDIKSFKIIIL
jgi:hypothetical protein